MGFIGVGNTNGAKQVIQVETGTIYSSCKEAALAVGLSSGVNISQVLKGKRNTAGGFHWIYK